MILKYVYVVFIGLLLALFIGVGIAAFYPGPKAPEPPSFTPTSPYESTLTASESALLRKQDQDQQKLWSDYNLKSQDYNKNVSIIAVTAAILILVISFLLTKQILIIADGLLLGGLLTLIYSIIRSFNSRDFKFMFIVVSIGLVVAIFLGYSKFIKGKSKN